ncbi:helix-turn-helix domain-containing protein [Bacillus sp. FSL W8-1127]|uniref:helix-turn-helix domain-containing protein n=1 Tax=Bacillus sp. FSL W8-1127 TaxID=2954710 RepID=UPI0030F7F37E
MDAKEFGLYLRSLRKRKGLTIDQLAELLDISNAYVSQIETGKKGIPSPELLKQFHAHLDVAYEHLMEKAGYMKKASPPSHDLFSVFRENQTIYYKGIKLTLKQKQLLMDLLEEFISSTQENKRENHQKES